MPEGRHKFVFRAEPPNPEKIPASEVVGVTVILLTCSYKEQVNCDIAFGLISNSGWMSRIARWVFSIYKITNKIRSNNLGSPNELN